MFLTRFALMFLHQILQQTRVRAIRRYEFWYGPSMPVAPMNTNPGLGARRHAKVAELARSPMRAGEHNESSSEMISEAQ